MIYFQNSTLRILYKPFVSFVYFVVDILYY